MCVIRYQIVLFGRKHANAVNWYSSLFGSGLFDQQNAVTNLIDFFLSPSRWNTNLTGSELLDLRIIPELLIKKVPQMFGVTKKVLLESKQHHNTFN